MDKKEEADKTVYYILETLKVLTENERYLLKRIEKLEGAMSEVATELFGEEEDDDEAEDRIIN